MSEHGDFSYYEDNIQEEQCAQHERDTYDLPYRAQSGQQPPERGADYRGDVPGQRRGPEPRDDRRYQREYYDRYSQYPPWMGQPGMPPFGYYPPPYSVVYCVP